MLRQITLVALLNYVFAWNPSSYPFIPASTDTTKIRDMIIESQGPNKRILDVGCGLGYSTSDANGCMGIDRNKYNVKKAQKLFPEKKFRHSFVNGKYEEEKYDVVTCMFYLNDLPQYLRKKTIESVMSIADERVVIVDIDPDYKPHADILRTHNHMEDYQKNCRNDLIEFSEHVIVDGMLNIWVYNKNQNNM